MERANPRELTFVKGILDGQGIRTALQSELKTARSHKEKRASA